MKINEAAKLAGVTVRTLQYYDKIGLLKPSTVTDAGYRLYSDADMGILQQILFFRELDFPLDEIKSIMSDPDYDQALALTRQKELLLKKRERIDGLIGLLDRTIKGEKNMSFKEFDASEIEAAKKKYANEVKERWGDTSAYEQYENKSASYGDKQWNMIEGQGGEILRRFGELRTADPAGAEAQAQVKAWQEHISANYYECTPQILAGLGLMYVGDERFTKYIDQFGEGTAAFMSKAIEMYCAS